MKFKIFAGFIGFIALMVALEFGFGYLGVLKTKTVGKAQQNAEREVFEQTQSYVEGKRQEAVKLYKEYQRGDDKTTICNVVSMQFANFDTKLLKQPALQDFIDGCMFSQ